MGLPLIYIIGLTLIAVFGILHLWIGYAKDYEEFVGSQQHLRFGKIISEAINNHHNIDLKPIFGALLSKTGGAVGIGPTWPISTNTLLFVEDGVLAYHGVAHDAGGYLCKNFAIAPGYEYIKPEWNKPCVKLPILGQISGILFWAKVLNTEISDNGITIDKRSEALFLSAITGLNCSKIDKRLEVLFPSTKSGKNCSPVREIDKVIPDLEPRILLGFDKLEERGLFKAQEGEGEGIQLDELIVNLASIATARRKIECNLHLPDEEPKNFLYYQTHYKFHNETDNEHPYIHTHNETDNDFHSIVEVTFPTVNEVCLNSRPKLKERGALSTHIEKIFSPRIEKEFTTENDKNELGICGNITITEYKDDQVDTELNIHIKNGQLYQTTDRVWWKTGPVPNIVEEYSSISSLIDDYLDAQDDEALD